MGAVGNVQVIEFGVSHERYAIKIDVIQEIIKMQDVTEIPNSKPYILGVINLRGKIVPIVSLRNRFGLPEEALTKLTRIVVVNYAEEMVGIVVDRVNQVTSISDIQPPPEQIGRVAGSYFYGIGQIGDGLVSLLDLERVLGD